MSTLPPIPQTQQQAPDVAPPDIQGLSAQQPLDPAIAQQVIDNPQLQNIIQSGMPSASGVFNQQHDQQAAQGDRVKQMLSNYLEVLSKNVAELNRPQGAGERFRTGFGEGMMHNAGVMSPTQRHQLAVSNAGDAVKAILDMQQGNRQQQQIDNSQQMVQMQRPDGTIVSLPQSLMGKLGGAFIRGDFSTRNTDANINSREKIAGLKMMAESGKVAKWMPVQGQNGVVMQGFGKDGQPVSGATVDNAVFPWLMQNTSSTMEYKETADGIVALPKTTVTSKQPIVASGQKAAVKGTGGGGGAVAPSGGLTARPVTGVGGEQLMPKLTSSTRTMLEAAPKVVSFVDRINALIDQQEKDLGPAKSRWSEFMAGKVGAPNAEFTKLRTNVGLLQTLLMRMHVGARGGEYIMKHFTDLMDSSKQSPENMRAAMGELKQYAQDLIAESQPPTPKAASGGAGVITLTDGGKSYKIPAALKASFLKDHPNAR